jgi:endoglucanase
MTNAAARASLAKRLRWLAVALTLILCLLQAGVAHAQDRSFDVAARLGRGVNILGYDGIWEGGTNAPFRMQNLRLIRQAGFRHVRINFFAFKHMGSDNLVDPAVLQRLDGVIEQTIAAGLIPVLDEHDYGECQVRLAVCETKLTAFWRQIADRYRGKYPSLVFELLNEPGGNMPAQMWNDLALRLLASIRASNLDRTIIVAAINSDDTTAIRSPQLPKNDRNLILTVHYYAPFAFTHQGAPWSPELAARRNITWGSAADRQKLRDDFQRINAWARAENRPVYLGEFGVFDAAPLEDRVRYLAAVTSTAESFGWPWAYWQFDHDFALFDSATQRWNAPVLDALMRR